MSRHDRLDESTRDRTALYALGSMDAAEAGKYEAHLAVCEACREEVRSLRSVCDSLSHLALSVPPPKELKGRLMERIRAGAGGDAHANASDSPTQTWKSWVPDTTPAGLTLVPGGDGDWEPTGVAGVDARKLFLDAANDRVTMLVRMAPKTSYPAHRHSGFEECYVLEGDLLVGDYRMRAGDYQRAGGGSLHGVQSTEAGCLLFIVSSLHDEILEAQHP